MVDLFKNEGKSVPIISDSIKEQFTEMVKLSLYRQLCDEGNISEKEFILLKDKEKNLER